MQSKHDQTFTIMQAACLLRFGGITKISIPRFYEMEQQKQDHRRHFILTVEMKDQEKMTRQNNRGTTKYGEIRQKVEQKFVLLLG